MYENGNLYKNGEEYTGDVSKFTQRTVDALDNIREGGNRGEALVKGLQKSESNIVISSSSGNSIELPNTSTNKSDNYNINFASKSTNGGPNQAGNKNRPAFIGLTHELAHAEDHINGTMVNTFWKGDWNINIPNAERYAMHVENQIRAENGLRLRTAYTTQSGRLIAPALVPDTRLSPNYFRNSSAANPSYNPSIPILLQGVTHIKNLYEY